MLAQKFTYKDFNGIQRTETHYFNLTEAEILDLEMDSESGLQEELKAAIEGVNNKKILAFIKRLIAVSYGERSGDGRHFFKSPEITSQLTQSAFYSDFLFSLFEDNGARGTKFINGVLPADLVQAAADKAAGKKRSPEDMSPKERFDARQRANSVHDPEVIDFTSFQEPAVQNAYSNDAERNSPPVQVLRPEDAEVTPGGPDPVPQRQAPTPSEDELERFRQWQASQQPTEQEDNTGVFRPPHESGPGTVQE